MRTSNQVSYALSVCAAVAILAGCNNGGSQAIPLRSQQLAAPFNTAKIESTLVASVAHGTRRVSPDGIVYTPADVLIENSQYNLDLKNNGTTDFVIADVTGKRETECDGQLEYNEWGELSLASISSPGNGYEMRGDYVARLRRGSPIGPSQSFRTETGSTPMEYMSITWPRSGPCRRPPVVYTGNWPPVHSGYLGLAFEIRGKSHYGWAAITPDGFSGATLTGYAYQTKAGKSIIAGQK